MPNYNLQYTGPEVDELLEKIEDLGPASQSEAGTMSAEDKAKLDGVAQGAQANVLEAVKLGGTALTPTEKAVNIPVDSAPTQDSNNLARSGGIFTAINNVALSLANYYLKTETYSKAEVNALVAAIKQFTYQVVATLPTASEQTMFVIYLIPSTNPKTKNVKDEFITVRSGSEGSYTYAWEQIGSTAVDLSDYSTTEEMNAAIATALEDYTTSAVLAGLLEQKANKDGYYAGMSVGTADNLVGRGSVEAEYQGIRTSAGKEDIGNGSALIREMQGKSIVWNQLVQNGDFADGTTNWSNVSNPVWSVTDGVATVTKAASDADIVTAIYNNIAFVVGHKYFVSALLKTNNTATEVSIKIQGGSPLITIQDYTQFAQWSRIKQISTNAGENTNLRIIGRNNLDNTQDINLSVADVMCIDLTIMFGEGKEPTSVAEFEKMFPLPYYAYNGGTIVNNEATGIKTVGFNLYNPATGKAVLPGKYSDYPYEYEICGAFTAISFEDYAGNVTTPELHDGRFFNVPAPGVLTVTGGNATDTLVHLVWSGWRNYGEPDYTFEPYWENVLQLNLKTITGKAAGSETSEVIYPDGMRSAGSAYDDLIVEADGYARKAVKVLDSKDLGSLNYTFITGAGAFINNFTAKSPGSAVICPKYLFGGVKSSQGEILSSRDKSIYIQPGNKNIFIKDSTYSGDAEGAANLKAALSGVPLYYELATPVVYTLDEPIYLGYPVDDFGTEAKLPVDSATLPTGPVRYSVLYPMNAVDAIRRLPVNYISKDSMDNFTAELASKLGAALGKTITITATYNTSTSAYDYDVTIEDAAPANTNEVTE